jgi:type I restriction enzyme S subunit
MEDTILSLSYGQVIVKPRDKLHGLVPESFETYQIVNPGNVIIRPTDLQNDKTSLRVGLAKNRGIITSAYLCLETSPRLLPEFAYNLLHSYDVMKIFYGLGSGLRQNLDFKDIKRLPILLPPLEEQQKIVSFIQQQDRRIRKFIKRRVRIPDLIKEQRLTLTETSIKNSVVPFERLERCAKQIFREIKRAPDVSYTPIGLLNRGRGIFLKAAALGSELGDSTFHQVQLGDLVISGQFAWEGALAIAGSGESGCVASHRFPLLRAHKEKCSEAYLLSFFQTSLGRVLLDQHSRGAAGRNRPLNLRSLMKEQIPLISLWEQNEIESLLKKEMILRTSVQKQVSKIREYLAKIISKAVTGSIDLRDFQPTDKTEPPGTDSDLTIDDPEELNEDVNEDEELLAEAVNAN